ncbi:MAG: hypothetical protein WBJ84_08530 [Bacteroidales bacterium]
MKVEICNYYNDHQTACSLMIDDLVPVAISKDGEFKSCNDWGYLTDKPGSLYDYLTEFLLSKYPEIKGTIFLPVDSHLYIPENQGYKVLKSGFDQAFLEFLKRINSRFEFAFHGIKHAWEDAENRIVHEFSNITSTEIQEVKQRLSDFSSSTGIVFNGGKFPGYKYNDIALGFIKDAKYNWWALNKDMLNKKSNKNLPLFNSELNIVEIPTNITGNVFKNFYWRNSRRRMLSNLLKFNILSHPIDLIRYFYENGIPITIQEHFQNQTTKGTRQPINIFDDIWSIDNLFGVLRGLDIWYATCSEIASYFIAKENTRIQLNGNNFTVTTSLPPNNRLSLKCSSQVLIDKNKGTKLYGMRKNEYWIFNGINSGSYEMQ